MKQYLLGVVAIVLVVGLFAFTAKHEAKSEKTFANYYGYTGTSNSELYQTGSWVSLGTQLPSQCGGANVVCIVTASQSNLSDFQTAIATANPQSEAQLDAMSGVDIFSRKNP